MTIHVGIDPDFGELSYYNESKKETVDFLLSYSRALTIVRTENGIYENIAN